MAKAKANAAQGIVEMLKFAILKKTMENKKESHKKNAKKGWKYYKTRFAIPIYNEQTKEITFNVYRATLIVRFAQNGKAYLYDMQEIKKEIRLAAEKLYVTMRAIAKLTEDHLNLLPRTGLMGHADFSAKKKSVAGHYNFVCSLGEKLTVATEQRSALLSLAEKLDMLSSQTIFEDSEAIFSSSVR